MKKITCTILLAFLGAFCHAQVQVGNGNADNKHMPVEPFMDYSYSQSIYMASEINSSGSISSLQWHYDGPGITGLANSQELTVYLGTTSKSSFASETDWEPIGNMTLAYAGSLEIDGNGFCTLAFQTPFVYNGVDNLIVAVSEGSTGSDSDSDNFLAFETPFNRSLVFYSGFVAINPLNPPFASNLVPFVPNVVFGGLSQACPPPLNVFASNISPNSVSLTWLGASADSQVEYYISESGIAPDPGTTISGSAAGSSLFVDTGLEPGKGYYVWIRNICDDVPGGWSAALAFSTDCTPVAIFNENFDLAVYYLPECWNGVLRGDYISESAMVNVMPYEFQSGVNAVMLTNDASSSDSDILLVSPNLGNLSAGTHRLKFMGMSYTTASLQIGTIGSDSQTAPFNMLDAVTLGEGQAEYIINFTTYAGADSHIAFRLNADAIYTSAMLDNIRWEASPLCPDVSGIIIPTVGHDTATVSWIHGGEEVEWDVAYGSGDANDPDILENIINVQGEAASGLTGLDADTTYKIWVRSICGTNEGAWIGPIVFHTACIPAAAFIENFDTTALDDLPACWSKILRGPSWVSGDIRVTNNHVKTVPNSVTLYNGFSPTTGGTDIILVSPALSNLGAGTHRLKFFAKGAGALEIGTLNGNNDQAVFTYYQDVVTTETLTEFTIDFQDNLSNDTFIGIRHNTADLYSHVNIDNLRWEAIPACADVTGITVSATTTSSATIGWLAGSDEVMWDVVYATTDTDPQTLPPVSPSPSTTGVTFEGLDINTTYFAWVRSLCGNGEGMWIGPVTFMTPCLPVSTINQDFDSTTMPSLPDCWSSIMRGQTVDENAYVATTENNSYSGSNAVAIGNAGSDTDGGDDIVLVSPSLANLGDATHRLRFFAKGDASLQIGTLDSNNPNALFTVLHTIASTDVTTEFILDFSNYSGSDTFIGIRHNGAYSYTSLFLDNIIWEPSPACPDVTGIVLAAVETNSAILNWSSAEAIEWELVSAISTVTDPESIATITQVGDAAETEIGSLQADTLYKAWIRSICGADKGNWIGPFSFRTSCEAVTDLSQGFESAIVPGLPGCWTSLLRGAQLPLEASVRSVNSSANSGTNSVAIFNYTYAEDIDIMLVSPNLGNLSTGTHQLRFSVGGYGASSLQIGTLDGNTSEAEFTLVDEIQTGSNFTEYTIDFSGYGGTDSYIAFRHSGNQSFKTILIDDVYWESALSISDAVLSTLNYYPNPVNDMLYITNLDDKSTITVYDLPGHIVLSQKSDAAAIGLDLGPIAPGNYIVQVASGEKVCSFKIIRK